VIHNRQCHIDSTLCCSLCASIRNQSRTQKTKFGSSHFNVHPASAIMMFERTCNSGPAIDCGPVQLRHIPTVTRLGMSARAKIPWHWHDHDRASTYRLTYRTLCSMIPRYIIFRHQQSCKIYTDNLCWWRDGVEKWAQRRLYVRNPRTGTDQETLRSHASRTRKSVYF